MASLRGNQFCGSSRVSPFQNDQYWDSDHSSDGKRPDCGGGGSSTRANPCCFIGESVQGRMVSDLHPSLPSTLNLILICPCLLCFSFRLVFLLPLIPSLADSLL
ncbi:hypothetical protein H1C71_039184 [Ictidomys tridecemlineatus]|nr:hypothetical protein H1C71_039184 [Ictidomys tridecemlineatus]KAG3256135.1 hypothetical protein H1C71_039184 [Ictidomys tridecemlineatus]